jgi:acetyltransferase-like isoleucine patch superfamily enzyme
MSLSPIGYILRILNQLFRSRLFLRWKYSRRFPGLGIADGVSLDVNGTFTYGEGCGVGTASSVLIPVDASLTLGDDCYIGRNVEICPSNDIKIGADTSLQDRCTILGSVSVGRHCLFGKNVYVSSGRHYFDLYPAWLIRDQDAAAVRDKKMREHHNKSVTIDDDCWIGTNTIIMAGVKVGKGAIIGANSVVNTDIAPYAVVAGAPARLIRYRLEYLPPMRIHYLNEKDWPYFYSGFQIKQAEIEKYSRYGGMAALGDFYIHLNCSSAKDLHLIIKTLARNECCIIWDSKEYPVFNTFHEVVLPLSESLCQSHKIEIKQGAHYGTLIICEAWVA